MTNEEKRAADIREVIAAFDETFIYRQRGNYILANEVDAQEFLNLVIDKLENTA